MAIKMTAFIQKIAVIYLQMGTNAFSIDAVEKTHAHTHTSRWQNCDISNVIKSFIWCFVLLIQCSMGKILPTPFCSRIFHSSLCYCCGCFIWLVHIYIGKQIHCAWTHVNVWIYPWNNCVTLNFDSNKRRANVFDGISKKEGARVLFTYSIFNDFSLSFSAAAFVSRTLFEFRDFLFNNRTRWGCIWLKIRPYRNQTLSGNHFLCHPPLPPSQSIDELLTH